MITTKFLGPTNHNGSRVRARDPWGRRVIVAWKYELGSHENHLRAACAHRDRFDPEAHVEYQGEIAGEDAYAFSCRTGCAK